MIEVSRREYQMLVEAMLTLKEASVKILEISARLRDVATECDEWLGESVVRLAAQDMVLAMFASKEIREQAAQETRERSECDGGGTSTETGKGKPARSECELAGGEAG